MRDATQKEFAEMVGLTTRQIRNLETEGLPHRAEGAKKFYPVPAAVLWIRDRDVKAAIARAQPTNFDDVRLREMTANAELAELEVMRVRGELIHRDDLERLYSAPLAQMRARMLALPGRIAADLPLPPVESVEVIERIVHEFMAELSEAEADEDDDAEANAA